MVDIVLQLRRGGLGNGADRWSLAQPISSPTLKMQCKDLETHPCRKGQFSHGRLCAANDMSFLPAYGGERTKLLPGRTQNPCSGGVVVSL